MNGASSTQPGSGSSDSLRLIVCMAGVKRTLNSGVHSSEVILVYATV